MEQTTRNPRNIRAERKTIYQALTDPRALEAWQAPGDMTAKIKDFDLKAGGGYQMSLFYPENEKVMKGKSFARDDRYKARFVKLTPRERIVQAINFETSDPSFMDEMIMEIDGETNGDETSVTFTFKNIPKGISLADNESGTISSLKKPGQYASRKRV